MTFDPVFDKASDLLSGTSAAQYRPFSATVSDKAE